MTTLIALVALAAGAAAPEAAVDPAAPAPVAAADAPDSGAARPALDEPPAAPAEATLLGAAAVRAAALLPDPAAPAAGHVAARVPVTPGLERPEWGVDASLLAGVADAFFGKVVVLASVRRALGPVYADVFGGRAFSRESPSLSLCSAAGSCALPASGRLDAAPGRLDWLAGAGVVAPVAEGKLSAGGLRPVRFSLEAGAHAAAVGYRVRDGSGPERSPFAPGLRLALGVGVAPTRAWAVRLDLASLLYAPIIRGGWSLERQLLLGATFEWRPGSRP